MASVVKTHWWEISWSARIDAVKPIIKKLQDMTKALKETKKKECDLSSYGMAEVDGLTNYSPNIRR